MNEQKCNKCACKKPTFITGEVAPSTDVIIGENVKNKEEDEEEDGTPSK